MSEAYYIDLLGPSSAEAHPNPQKDVDLPSAVHESTLAAFLGISRTRIVQLVGDGILHRSGRAQFPLKKSVQAYCEKLRDSASPMGRGRSTSSNPELNAEKLRLAKEQADKIELRNAAARGELVKSGQVEREWASVLRDVRAAMLAVPSRCGATLPHLTAHDIQTIEVEIKNALEGLADGD
ncbi:DNA packaging protein [Marivita sp. S2033]|uniref:DNA packaging protein n=1 Tax=Marivita sp. S2033 TaxID=3373187 RepID=UPI003982C15B